MGTESSVPTTPDKAWVKENARRRVFGFFWVFFIVAIAQVFSEETALDDAIDNYIGITVAAIAIIVLLVMWRKSSTTDLRKTNNILAVLAAVLALTFVIALYNESSDPSLLGDDYPTLFFGIFMLINRFV